MVVTKEKQEEVFANCKDDCPTTWWAGCCPCRNFESNGGKSVEDIFGEGVELDFPRRGQPRTSRAGLSRAELLGL